MKLTRKMAEIELLARNVMERSKAQPFREEGYIYHHGKRVAGLCFWLLKSLRDKKTPRLPLYAAALFHDIAKGRNHHARIGAQLIPGILNELCRQTEIADISRLVSEHNLRDRPNLCRKDSRILQDADALDHFGAQNIWLSIYHTCQNHGAQDALIAYLRGTEQKEYISYCRAGLNFEISKKEFKKRLSFQREFLRQLERDIINPN